MTAQDEDPDAKPILTGQATDLKLKDVRGLDYDDPKWEELLDSMTLDEMNTLISLGGFQTSAVESIGKVRRRTGTACCVHGPMSRHSARFI